MSFGHPMSQILINRLSLRASERRSNPKDEFFRQRRILLWRRILDFAFSLWRIIFMAKQNKNSGGKFFGRNYGGLTLIN
jgi:hypothetical protein